MLMKHIIIFSIVDFIPGALTQAVKLGEAHVVKFASAHLTSFIVLFASHAFTTSSAWAAASGHPIAPRFFSGGLYERCSNLCQLKP